LIRRLLELVVVALLAGAGGWYLGAQRAGSTTGSVPDEWLARVGERYITPAEFTAEMERRGGRRPGQYHELEQRQRLLDDMIFRAAMVEAARADGLHRDPEVRRSMEAILINKYTQTKLEPMRDAIEISPDEVRGYYEAHGDDYIVPARKRLAMIHLEVNPNAPESRWEETRARAEQLLEQARALDIDVPHFGDLARRHSDHRGSRYRGGIIGWLSAEGRRPRFNAVVTEAAAELDQPGQLSPVLRGEDGYYLVRLVQSEPRRERSLEQLTAGIRQRILREKLQQVERDFQAAQMNRVDKQINQAALAAVAPLSPPVGGRREPPGGPSDSNGDR